MEKLLEVNIGLPSRFPNKFIFEDFTNAELLLVLHRYMNNAKLSGDNKFKVTDAKWTRIAIRRLANKRNIEGFANARAVRTMWDSIRKRQTYRLDETSDTDSDMFTLERDDFLGPKASKTQLQTCGAYNDLLNMEGLDEVKQEVDSLIDLMVSNADNEENEVALAHVNLNRVFVGNPGTGKTTVAKIYAKILCHLGMLSKGEFIFKGANDFVGDVIGSSEKTTRNILNNAEGSVLVIDEAYSLNPSTGTSGSKTSDPYREGVINTIVEIVQGNAGDDRAVLLLGYKEEMDDLFEYANQGLKRRFQYDDPGPVEFVDYNDDSLGRILRALIKKNNMNLLLEQQLRKYPRSVLYLTSAMLVLWTQCIGMQSCARLSEIPVRITNSF